MKLLFILLTLFLLSGCSTNSLNRQQPVSISPEDETPIIATLYQEYQRWDKTPYLLGGDSLDGIDCSALVQKIYKNALGLTLPRTTQEQAKAGYWIGKRRLREGDLVLFKTGYKTRHAGIYLENGNFINTSKKYGVTISNLNNPYWKSKYWQSRRVLP